MWVSGILQGLMWRAYNNLGVLEYSFVETVDAMHPFYVIQATGGLLFVLGSLIMVYIVGGPFAATSRRWRRGSPALPLRPSFAGSGRVGEAINWSSHQVLEKSSVLLLIGILITVAIGGIVEIAPLYWLARRSTSPGHQA